MKRITYCLMLALAAAPSAAIGQFLSNSIDGTGLETGFGSDGGGSTRPVPVTGAVPRVSRVGIGVGVSPLGIGVEAATNVAGHFNVRASGSFFNYNTSFTTSGFTANAKLNLSSARVSLDYYPFNHGFRLSPGLMVMNNNRLTATDTVAGGTSFTLNGDTFYSANANSATGAAPANGNARLGLNSTKPAFTMTTGWGNMVPRKGWPVSFPFEFGAAFVGAPSLNATLGGWACYDQAQTQCTDLSSNSPIALQVQGDLKAQVSKWTSDLNALRTYPIVSVGVAYSFKVRGVE